MQCSEVGNPPSYEEATLQDLPHLKSLGGHGEFLVYPRDIKGRHDIKTADKNLIYKGKWKSFDSLNQRLTVKNPDEKEILTMTRQLEDKGLLNYRPKKEMVMTVEPDVHVGKLSKKENHVYEVIDQSGKVVYHVEKVLNKLHMEKYNKIMTPDGKDVGTIGDNKGDKLVLNIPSTLPVSHKALLLGLTLSKQDVHDDETAAAITSSAAGGAVVVAM